MICLDSSFRSGDWPEPQYSREQLNAAARALVLNVPEPDDLLEKANEKYIEAEKQVRLKPGTDAVLVSVDSLAALEKAYPNYFADTRVFVELLRQALSGQPARVFTGQLTLAFD